MAFVGTTGLQEAQVIALLEMTARHVYWSGDLSETPELRSFLHAQTLPVTREDLTSPRLLGKLRLGFGGISADKVDGRYVNITDGRFDPFIDEVVLGLKGTLGSVVFGGTYWSFMPELARVADKKARVTLTGVMPQQGLSDLLTVSHLFEGDDPVPKKRADRWDRKFPLSSSEIPSSGETAPIMTSPALRSLRSASWTERSARSMKRSPSSNNRDGKPFKELSTVPHLERIHSSRSRVTPESALATPAFQTELMPMA